MQHEIGSNEIRITRVYSAPVTEVWDAWEQPARVERWWGPRGFTLTTRQKDMHAGGTWRYTMHGPDGVDYPNLTLYHTAERHRRLVYDHGATDTSPPLFRVTATFTEAGGHTTLDLVFAFATPEAAAGAAVFIREAGGEATWDRLAEHLAETATGDHTFVITRSFDASAVAVFDAWVDEDTLARWLPPTGTTLRWVRRGIAAGETTRFEIVHDQGAMLVAATYEAIERPDRLVYAQRFVDNGGRTVLPPGADAWPSALRQTVSVASDGPHRTRVTVTTAMVGEQSSAATAAFVAERSGMTEGWTGSFDALDTLLRARSAA